MKHLTVSLKLRSGVFECRSLFPEVGKHFLRQKVSEEINDEGNCVGVRWAYFFYPKDLTREPTASTFSSKTKIAPGKEKTLSERGHVITDQAIGSKCPPSKRECFSMNGLPYFIWIMQMEVWPTPHP
jgi:hypothetical protein